MIDPPLGDLRFTEKRKSPHTQVSVFDTTALSTPWTPAEPGVPIGQVLDLTPAGARIHTSRRPPADGQEIHLHLTLQTDEPVHVDLTATVRWQRPADQEGHFEFGVEFAPDQALEDTRTIAQIVLFHCG